MDLESVCKNIYCAAFSAAGKAEAPVAYIRTKKSKDFPFSGPELVKAFSRLRWDSNLAAADLVVEEDDSLPAGRLEIAAVEEFMDDEGHAVVHQVQDEDRFIDV